MTLRQSTGICSNPGFLLEPRRNFPQELQGHLMQKSHLLGLTTWKVVQRNGWKDIAELANETTHKFSKSQRHAWMTTILETKK